MELFHVLNRGVEKRRIFMDDRDRMRFCHGLFLFNDARHIDIANLRERLHPGHPMSWEAEKGRKPLVDIHAWCLMNNHYHLLLSERQDKGISRFLQKLNIGYAKYFNERYVRSGTLFQGKTKKVLIDRDAHFMHIVHYIHFNPLDMLPVARYWREGSISDFSRAKTHLASYQWSSYLDYCERANMPSILTKGLYDETYQNYEQSVATYLRDIDMRTMGQLTLE